MFLESKKNMAFLASVFENMKRKAIIPLVSVHLVGEMFTGVIKEDYANTSLPPSPETKNKLTSVLT